MNQELDNVSKPVGWAWRDQDVKLVRFAKKKTAPENNVIHAKPGLCVANSNEINRSGYRRWVIFVDYEVQGLSNGFLPEVLDFVFWLVSLRAFAFARPQGQRSERYDYSAYRLAFLIRFFAVVKHPYHFTFVLT